MENAIEPDGGAGGGHAIRISGLSYKYPRASSEALSGLDVEVGRGEIFGFLGPSGAGKSTAVKILTGLLDGYAGKVSALGYEPGKAGAAQGRAYRSKIGVAFEFPYLYERFSAIENLEFFAAFYDDPETDLLGLLDSMGLRSAADKRVSQFSKGMRVRLNFLRALLPRPELLFLDEPTSGLDPENAQIMKDAIREKARSGTTVFLTTHAMDVADQLCDRVGFLVDGKLRAVAAPRDLKRDYGRKEVRVEWRGGPHEIREEVFPLAGLGADAGFRAMISSKEILSIHSGECSLEQVFLKVTGRSLE
jgi:fluoroquinolone transport system ATP-binding protein